MIVSDPSLLLLLLCIEFHKHVSPPIGPTGTTVENTPSVHFAPSASQTSPYFMTPQPPPFPGGRASGPHHASFASPPILRNKNDLQGRGLPRTADAIVAPPPMVSSPVKNQKCRVSSQSKSIELNFEETDFENLFIANPEMMELNGNNYAFLSLEFPTDVTSVDAKILGSICDVTVHYRNDWFRPSLVAGRNLGIGHIVSEQIKTWRRKIFSSKDETYSYRMSFDLPFEAEPAFSKALHPTNISHNLVSNVLPFDPNTNTKFENVFLRSLILVFRERKSGYGIDTTVDEVEAFVPDENDDGDY